MIYQKHIPREELFSAQLETLIQHGRFATLATHLVGVAATLLLFWQYLAPQLMLLWAAGFLILLLLRALQMSNALVERRFLSSPKRVYWQLLMGAAATGAAWSSVYILAAAHIPATTQYMFLLVIVMITAFSVGFSVVIREYFVAFVFTSLFPIAWWSLVHYWEQPYNLLIGGMLLGICALLVSVSDRVYQTFRNMISLNWERETISRELADLTSSLRDRNRQLRDARRQLTDLANVDELTGLGNRRMVNNVLQDEINRARRAGTELSVILLDVDCFKSYNDNHGHPAGDEILKRLADLMQRATSRAGELVGRYGGEEFILVLPGADRESAMRTARRLQELVMAEAIPHGHSDIADTITISQGVATLSRDGEPTPGELIQRADSALYDAKNGGRNMIRVAA